MEDSNSFSPSVVVAVGLAEPDVEQLRGECTARSHRLVVAPRQSDLPISLQCDFAIVSTLLPDGDGRKLATEFARTGARVLLLGNVGDVPLYDVWTLGATVPDSSEGPAEWLDDLSRVEHVEAVSRAGRLLDPLRLADAVESAAAFSGATGVPVSFVRIRPSDPKKSAADDLLDRLTSVVGMTTVFHDLPSGERVALVVSGDRRRIARLLESAESGSKTRLSVIELSPGDDLPSLVGRSLLGLRKPGDEARAKVLVAVAPGSDKTSEVLRMALHKMDLSPVYWDASFRFDENRSNSPVCVVVDTRQDGANVSSIIDSALSSASPIPIIAVSDEENVDGVRSALVAGASDFLIWPFQPGEVQAAIARVLVVGATTLQAPPVAPPAPVDAPAAPTPSKEAGTEPVIDVPEIAESKAAPESERVSEPKPESATGAKEPADVESAFADIVGELLSSGQPVALKGLGVLNIQHETSRIVHDKHGRTIVEPPKRKLVFVQESPPDNEGQQG